MDLIPASIFSSEPVQIARAVGGSILVFFVPGFVWTLVFFKKVHITERIALAIGISVALVTLSLVVLNVIFNIDINLVNSLVVISVLTVIPLVIYLCLRFIHHKPKTPGGE